MQKRQNLEAEKKRNEYLAEVEKNKTLINLSEATEGNSENIEKIENTENTEITENIVNENKDLNVKKEEIKVEDKQKDEI